MKKSYFFTSTRIAALVMSLIMLLLSSFCLFSVIRIKDDKNHTFFTDYEKSAFNGNALDKNLIIIEMSDMQQFVLNLSIDGNEVMPNINSLSSESISFSNYYSPLCHDESDIEFTIFNSIYSPIYGQVGEKPAERRYNAFPSFFKALDYETEAIIGENPDLLNRTNVLSAYGFERVSGASMNDSALYQRALGALDSDTKKLLYINASQSEAPYNAVDNHTFSLDNITLNNYINAMNAADDALGDFIAALKDKELYDNSVIMIVGEGGALDYNSVQLSDAIHSITDIDYGYADYCRAPLIIHIPDSVKS